MDKKIIILIVILIAVILLSGFIKTPIEKINDVMPTLSQNIESGNSNYNKAVRYSNNHDYVVAEEKAQSASNDFLDAQNKILDIKKYHENLNDTLYLQYLDLIEEELNLKQNASTNLQLAIQAFKNGDRSSANEYVRSANKVMNKGIKIQKQRDYLVKNHPDKFITQLTIISIS
jgi:cellobiose-specific phosphotransferase system component IIA